MEVGEHYKKLDDVALLTEGVDRNSPEGLAGIKDLIVALLTEGVDRNRKQLVGR